MMAVLKVRRPWASRPLVRVHAEEYQQHERLRGDVMGFVGLWTNVNRVDWYLVGDCSFYTKQLCGEVAVTKSLCGQWGCLCLCVTWERAGGDLDLIVVGESCYR